MFFPGRKTIGLFINKDFDYFDSSVFHALERESRRLNVDVVVFLVVGHRLNRNVYDEQERQMFAFAPVERLDGIMIVPDSFEVGGNREALYDMLRERVTCPVFALRNQSDLYPCVYTDESEAIRPLVRHLIEDHGLRRICFQGGFPGHADAEARLAAFRAEMAAHGLPIPENGIFRGDMWIYSGEEAYAHFFSDPAARPEAIVCANDFMAVSLMRVMERNGIRIPEDVIVTGFDHMPGLGIDEPGLTTIQPNYNEMVVRAMDYFDRYFRDGTAPEAPFRVPLKGKLILGESCGCKRRDPKVSRGVVRDTVRELEEKKARETTMSYFGIEVSACDSLKDLHAALARGQNDLPMVRDLYLCLFGDADEPATEMTDTACLVHAMRDHEDCGMPMITFDQGRLLPPMAERPGEPQLLFVKLLHQQGSNYGYAVFQYEAGRIPTRSFTLWNVLVSGALQNIHKRRELMALYEERRLSSITDPLTGLLNRRGLQEKAEPIWPSLCARGAHTAFVFLDMDGLKRVNDSYGHAAGDFGLRLIGRAVQNTAPGNAIAARIGGDEFIILLPGATALGAKSFISAFTRDLDRLNREENRTFSVNASAGFYACRLDPGVTVESCLRQSDAAMYEAKAKRRQGKNAVPAEKG